jgi:hypothetical protein
MRVHARACACMRVHARVHARVHVRDHHQVLADLLLGADPGVENRISV